MLNYHINYIIAFESTLNANGYRLIRYDFFGKQIKSMQAWEISADVEDVETGEVINIPVLQSYNTLVAYKIGGKTVRCGKWSRTTSKQTSTWERM